MRDLSLPDHDLPPSVGDAAGWATGTRRGGVARDVGLPVEVEGPPHVVTQVSAFVEATLGWQVTDGAGLPAVVRLLAVGGSSSRSAEATPDGPRRRGDLPTVVLVGPDDDPIAAASRARSAAAVVAWPADHDALAGAVDEVLGRASPAVERDRVVRVAGAAGGVGTSTVALVLGAWLAWAGGRALVVTTGAVPVPDLHVVAPDVVAGHRVWAAARPVPGVPGLRVVGCTGPVDRVASPPGVQVVVDDGVVAVGGGVPAGPGEVRRRVAVDLPEGPDVLVVRRDRAGLDAVVEHPGAAVVLVDRGPRRRREVDAHSGRREVVVVPDSARVQRAHERRAIPASVPDVVLKSLRDVLSDVESEPDSTNVMNLASSA